MATPTISANENTTTTSAEFELLLSLPNLLLIQQTALVRTKVIFLHLKCKRFPREKEEKTCNRATTPAASPADSAPQTGQDRSSEPTTSTSPVTTETKAEEPIEDNYFRIHVKNFLKKTRMLRTMDLGRC